MQNFTESEIESIKDAILSHVSTIGAVEFVLKVRPYKGRYLLFTSIIMLALIFFQGLPLYFFFLPLLPIIVLNIVYFVDMNIVVWSITKAQTYLINNNIRVDWETMMDYTFDYFQQLIHQQND